MKWMLYAKDVNFDDYYCRAVDLPHGWEYKLCICLIWSKSAF